MALRGKLGSTAGWDMAPLASTHPHTCQHNRTNTATPALPPSPQPTLPRQTLQVFNKKVQKIYTDTNPRPRRSHRGRSRQSTLEAGAGQRGSAGSSSLASTQATLARFPHHGQGQGTVPQGCWKKRERRAAHQPNLDPPHMSTPLGGAAGRICFHLHCSCFSHRLQPDKMEPPFSPPSPSCSPANGAQRAGSTALPQLGVGAAAENRGNC